MVQAILRVLLHPVHHIVILQEDHHHLLLMGGAIQAGVAVTHREGPHQVAHHPIMDLPEGDLHPEEEDKRYQVIIKIASVVHSIFGVVESYYKK